MFINQSIFTLLRRIPPEAVIDSWLNTVNVRNYSSKPGFLYKNPDFSMFRSAMRNDFQYYSSDEIENVFSATRQILQSGDIFRDSGVFGLLVYSVEDILRLDSWSECICRFSKLVKFRELTHPIGQELFVAAYLAKKDTESGYDRRTFSFPPVVRTDNLRLHQMLDRGMAENHFHIGGSVSAFLYSWICLMNHMSCEREKEFQARGLDKNPLDQSNAGNNRYTESFYSLVFKAACIRYFLFLRLHDTYPLQKNENGSDEFHSNKWLMERLQASEEYLSLYMVELDTYLSSCRLLYCPEASDGSFVPDYAIETEPYPPMDDDDIWSSADYAVRNYERRVYRSIAGEQRFLYRLFHAIYMKDPAILPYADLAYAYLLIYSKVRSELIQTNKTVGFANFDEYQVRKDDFSWHYPQYSQLRSRVAQQAVLLNPQIRSLEGRMIPANKCDKLIDKITNTFKNAVYTEDYYNDDQKEYTWKCAEEKLHYVLHIAKKKQEIQKGDEVVELFEMTHPRDSLLRKSIDQQVNAIIKARNINPQIRCENGHTIMPLARVTGIDACANEIGCRPEVFAPAFRKIRHNKLAVENRLQSVGTEVLPSLRITYHVGEDFLDITDGLRAIDEAICFFELECGDRLGHAIALGLDPEMWYSSKNYTLVLPKQDLMDNMAWLMNKMHTFNIYERSAEDEIQSVFRKCYEEVILDTVDVEEQLFSVDIHKYYDSMLLRGNDPMLYAKMPSVKEYNDFRHWMKEEVDLYPWRAWIGAKNFSDWTSNRLCHYYHYNYYVKQKGSEQTEYQLPYSMINVVQKIQKKMQHKVASLNLGIETNPSSNYLISTFRDYCKHPIFSFNDSGLYDKPDNPHLFVSINTDDLGVFDTSLENEYALMAAALENYNEYVPPEKQVSPEKIYNWLDHIRQMGCDQSFRHIK